MEQFWQILIAFGVPAGLFGFLIWYIQIKMTKADKEREKQQKNLESLVLLQLQSTRANTILCVATAEAVRDGHCNGNMTAALKAVEAVAAKEKEFLLEKSIKYIFE
jgi:hypothetical protein